MNARPRAVFLVGLLAIVACACSAVGAPGVPAAASTSARDASASSSSPSASPSLTALETTAPTAAATASEPPTEAPAPAPTPTVRTPRPTVATPQPTARTSVYTTLPPAAALPSEQQCAAEVGTDPWEPRPDNRAANQANAWTQGFRLTGSYLATMAPGYQERVTGNFTGTTDQILRWAACKWGFDEQDVRAQAVMESHWHQSTLGDCNDTTQPQTKGCASVGVMQVKGADIPATHPGTWPAAMTSTAFNVDYALAVRRLCFEGKETWLRQYNPYAAGDLWGCIGRWYSGRWHDAAAEQYITHVRAILSARPWLAAGF